MLIIRQINSKLLQANDSHLPTRKDKYMNHTTRVYNHPLLFLNNMFYKWILLHHLCVMRNPRMNLQWLNVRE